MPRKSYTVKMYDNKPFTFDWDEERPLTQSIVKELYEQEGPPLPDFEQEEADTRDPYFKDKIEPYKAQPSLFGNLGEDAKVTDTLPDVEFEQKPEQSWWDWANESWLPNRNSAETALPGLKTLSRAGDWAYSRIAQPAASPMGVATLPLTVNPVGRAALGVVGTGMGAYGLTQTVPEAWENPSLESVGDVGLSALGAASLPIGWKYGAFGKPTRNVDVSPNITPSAAFSNIDLDVGNIMADPPTPKRLGSSLFGQKQLYEDVPKEPIILGDVEGPTITTRRPSEPLTGYELTQIPGEEALTTRDFPTVGGTGTTAGPLKTRTIKGKNGKPDRTVVIDTTLPRVGGVGEYGVRGEPFFPTVPERMQTSTTQEGFRPAGEMLDRMARDKRPRTEGVPFDIEQPPVVETRRGWTTEEQTLRDMASANVDEWGRTRLPQVSGQPTLGQQIRAERRAGLPDVEGPIERSARMVRGEPIKPVPAPAAPARGGTVRQFQDLAMEQRGKPESIMERILLKMGGGALHNPLMDVGDIMHRMNERVTFKDAGYETVRKKVQNSLEALRRGFDFGLDVDQSIGANAKFRGVDPTELRNEVRSMLDTYADEHGKLPTYNRAQDLAKEAAVAMGKRDWGAAERALAELDSHLGSKDEWVTFAREGLIPDVENPASPNRPPPPTQRRPGGPTGPQGPIQDITPRKPLSGLGGVEKATKSSSKEVARAAQQVIADRGNVKKKGVARRVYDQLFTSGWTILDDMGEPGKQVSRWMQKVRADGEVQAGRLSNKRRDIIDQVKDKDFAQVVDVVEGNATSTDPKINAAAEAVRATLEEAGVYAEQAGAMMHDLKQNLVPFKRMKEGYFPHKFEPGTFNEESLINSLMKEKKMTYEEAKFVVDNGVKHGPRLLSPQHMRSLDLTGYKKTKQAFYEHIDDLITRAEETKNFGPKDEKLHALAAQTHDPERASSIINEQLGRTTKDPDRQAIAHAVNTFEATVKLPLFAISNMNQAAAIGMRASTKNFLKGFGKSIKSIKSAEGTGSLQTVARNTFQDTGTNRVTKGFGKVFQWGKSEEFLRSWAGNTGKAQADTLFTQLKKNPANKTARAKLDNLLLEDVDTVLKQDALTPDQIDRAGFRMSELTQGLVDPADLPPIWSADPLMKIPLMFKRFAFQQNRILKGAFKEAATPADKAKLGVKALALYTAIGEGTEDTKNVVRSVAAGEDPIKDFLDRGGRPEEIYTDNKAMDRMIDNISNAYAMGLIGEVLGQAGSGVPGRMANMTIGPALGDAFAMLEAAGRSKNQKDATPLLKEFVRRGTPLGYSTSKRFPENKRERRPKSLLPSMPKINGFKF